MLILKTLWRGILWDTVLYTLLALSCSTIVLIVQNVLRYLDRLISAGVEAGGLLAVMAIVLPTYFAYALPVSLLMGVLLALGRMSADGETVAMAASGVSVWRLLPPVALVGTIMAVCSAYLIHDVQPRSHERMGALIKELVSASTFATPGRFTSLGNHVIYVDSRGEGTCPLQGVLIGDFSESKRTSYISARCGNLWKDEQKETTIDVELAEGTIHFSDVDSDGYRMIGFQRMTAGFDFAQYVHRAPRVRDRSTRVLLELDRRFQQGESVAIRDGELGVRIELHKRFAFSFACIVLGFLAIPLGIRPVRSGRSAGALTAVGLMGLYWLFFTGGEIAAEQRWIPASVGLWAPNAGVLAAGLWLTRLVHRNGV